VAYAHLDSSRTFFITLSNVHTRRALSLRKRRLWFSSFSPTLILTNIVVRNYNLHHQLRRDDGQGKVYRSQETRQDERRERVRVLLIPSSFNLGFRHIIITTSL
jgi:hypothetical protein